MPAGDPGAYFRGGGTGLQRGHRRAGLPHGTYWRVYGGYFGRDAGDAGATAVIAGHSERRTLHHETDAQVRAKVLAAWRAKLMAIVCIGETRGEREAKRTLDVIGRQLDGSLPDGATTANLVVAYEPVWAIGTGLTPTAADVAEVHRFIRERLAVRYGNAEETIRILYGGSVKPSNAKELMGVANIDGALIGGASLKADEFLGIANVYR